MIKKLFLISLLSLISLPALSSGGEAVNATITSVGTGPFYTAQCGFPCMVVITNPSPPGPRTTPCDYHGGWHFAIDLSSSEASSMVSTILAANAARSKVGIRGTGECLNLGIEKVYYIYTSTNP